MNNIVGGIDISRWATDSNHERNVAEIYQKIKSYISNSVGSPYSLETRINSYIQNNDVVKREGGSPVTASMILKTAEKYKVDPILIMAIAHADSHYGTVGKAVRTKNPGNWGNDDTGAIRVLSSWEEGIDKIGYQLDRYRGNMSKQSLESFSNFNDIIGQTNYTKVKSYDNSAEVLYGSPIDLISPATKAQQAKQARERELIEEANLKSSTVPESTTSKVEYLQELKNNLPLRRFKDDFEENDEIPELFVSVFNPLKELSTVEPKFVTPSFYKSKPKLKKYQEQLWI